MANEHSPDDELPVIARFEVRRRGYLGPDGAPVGALPRSATDIELLISLYRGMVLARAFDLKAVSLQRTGRLGTYAVSLGQEAAAIGVASAMRPEDVLLPSYRDNAALLWRGMKMEEILLFWGGDERGNCYPDRPMISLTAFPSDRRRHTPPALPMLSSSEKNHAWQSACSATVPLRRGTYGRL